jgi:hypothetical protein
MMRFDGRYGQKSSPSGRHFAMALIAHDHSPAGDERSENTDDFRRGITDR